ncbi:MAG: hypothetical protein WCW31_00360 [Patescibacteria group bacterium]
MKDQNGATFTKREHVIMDSLGSFTPYSLTLLPEYGVVCDSCNELFSPLETNFTEDTWEGVYGQRLGIKKRRSVVLREKNFKIKRVCGLGGDFFDQIFFFLELRDGKVVPVLKDQIKLWRSGTGYRIFLLEGLEAVKEGTSEYKKLVRHFKNLDQKDIHIFGETSEKVEQMKVLLMKFGVNYKEKTSKGWAIPPGTMFELKEDVTCTLDIALSRILAKTAFNYFAYCAVQEGMQHILLGKEFSTLRRFIHEGYGELKQIIPSINEEPILGEEHATGGRFLGHVLSFLPENGQIVVHMTFFGLPAIYKVVLGDIPHGLDATFFGCGHAFNPFDGRITNLTQQMPANPTEEQIRLSCGLFKRERVV